MKKEERAEYLTPWYYFFSYFIKTWTKSKLEILAGENKKGMKNERKKGRWEKEGIQTFSKHPQEENEGKNEKRRRMKEMKESSSSPPRKQKPRKTPLERLMCKYSRIFPPNKNGKPRECKNEWKRPHYTNHCECRPYRTPETPFDDITTCPGFQKSKAEYEEYLQKKRNENRRGKLE